MNKKYRLNAEWIPYMKAYRIYDPHKPQRTIAYSDDDIDRLDEIARENGYDGISECDSDSMHVELYDEQGSDPDEPIVLAFNGGRK
ncbi:MAG: hypothetical protein IJR70_06055 [Eubacterium sp.]|nr:hypothetical protein [Eubacterium sp.]